MSILSSIRTFRSLNVHCGKLPFRIYVEDRVLSASANYISTLLKRVTIWAIFRGPCWTAFHTERSNNSIVNFPMRRLATETPLSKP